MEKKEKLGIFVFGQSDNCTGKVDNLRGNSGWKERLVRRGQKAQEEWRSLLKGYDFC